MIRVSRRALTAAVVAALAALAIGAPVAPLALAKQDTGCTTGSGMVFMPNPVVTLGTYDGLTAAPCPGRGSW